MVAAQQRLVGGARHAGGSAVGNPLRRSTQATDALAHARVVDGRVEQPAEAQCLAGVAFELRDGALADRPDRDVDRAVADTEEDADLPVTILVVLEQRAERELEVVERLERQVVPCCDPAGDQLGDD